MYARIPGEKARNNIKTIIIERIIIILDIMSISANKDKYIL